MTRRRDYARRGRGAGLTLSINRRDRDSSAHPGGPERIGATYRGGEHMLEAVAGCLSLLGTRESLGE